MWGHLYYIADNSEKRLYVLNDPYFLQSKIMFRHAVTYLLQLIILPLTRFKLTTIFSLQALPFVCWSAASLHKRFELVGPIKEVASH